MSATADGGAQRRLPTHRVSRVLPFHPLQFAPDGPFVLPRDPQGASVAISFATVCACLAMNHAEPRLISLDRLQSAAPTGRRLLQVAREDVRGKYPLPTFNLTLPPF